VIRSLFANASCAISTSFLQQSEEIPSPGRGFHAPRVG
jgi:hypothetical protein